MKTIFSAALSALALMAITGCANQTTTPKPTAKIADPGSRTYSQDDIKGTGQTNVGPALETLDPAVHSRGR